MDVMARMAELMLAKDMAGVAALWAPDGTAEFPFAEAGAPTRLHGRDQVRAYLAGYPDRFDVAEVAVTRAHRTDDPDTTVYELFSRGRTVRTGAPYRMEYVAVVTVRDGLIGHYRDYWSPVQVARAAGTLAELAGALGAESPGAPPPGVSA